MVRFSSFTSKSSLCIIYAQRAPGVCGMSASLISAPDARTGRAPSHSLYPWRTLDSMGGGFMCLLITSTSERMVRSDTCRRPASWRLVIQLPRSDNMASSCSRLLFCMVKTPFYICHSRFYTILALYDTIHIQYQYYTVYNANLITPIKYQPYMIPKSYDTEREHL